MSMNQSDVALDGLFSILTNKRPGALCKADLRQFLFLALIDPESKNKQNTAETSTTRDQEEPSTEFDITTVPDENSTSITEETEYPDYYLDVTTPSYEDDLLDFDQQNSSKKADMFITEFASIAKDQSKASLLQELADDLSEFILDCSFFGTTCLDKSEWQLAFATDYGSCFTFNSAFSVQEGINGTDEMMDKEAYSTGSSNGLSVEVMLNQDNYLPQTTAAGAGVRVAISTPGIRPNPADEGYSVRPNKEADFAFRLQQVTRQPDPYESHCWAEWGQTPFQPLFYHLEMNETTQLTAYSYGECILLCSSYLLAQDCGCVDPKKHQRFLYNGEEITAQLPVCDYSNETQKQCQSDVLRKMRNDPSYSCDCNLPCEETHYLVTSSTSQWPSGIFKKNIVKKYFKQLEKIGNEDFASDNWRGENERNRLLKQELGRINVYLQTLNVKEVSEDPKYDLSQTLGAVGGALGLYVGFCGITFFELAEFFILGLLAIAGYNHTKMVEASESKNEGKQTSGSPRATPANKGPRFLTQVYAIFSGGNLMTNRTSQQESGIIDSKKKHMELRAWKMK